MLIENENLYHALDKKLRTFYDKDEYVFVHAIYEPDDEIHNGMYHAAVDLHEPGVTYHVYFIANNDHIIVDTIEHWRMG